MFTFRRKPKQEPESTAIRTSPSLPELNSQGIPWPENLVDIAAIRELPPPEERSPQGAAKTSFQGSERAIPFHKPFRHPPGRTSESGAISSFYMSAGSPPTFEPKKAPPIPLAGRYSQRRARVPPTFNLMVVGAKGTGKTSLLRLLLETADISPAATVDQKAALTKFLKGSTKATQGIQAACLEICESRFDRILFSVIDTPGLDFQEGRELRLERQVGALLKYVDAQYADTMSEESKVVRQSKGDQHIHLCIYMIDPASIMTAEERSAQSSFPIKTRSETTVSQVNPPELVPDTSSDDESDDDELLTMSPVEIRVIRRLAARANVLPVIAHADSLTDEMLRSVKKAVRTGLSEAGIDFGVFALPDVKTFDIATSKRKTQFAIGNGSVSSHGHDDSANDDEVTDGNADEAEQDDEERAPRPVIKLRPKRHGRPLSRSRSRRDLSQIAEDDRRPVSPDSESVANVRFSAHIVSRNDVSELLPFALIAPEPGRHRPVKCASIVGSDRESSPVPPQSENGTTTADTNIPQTPASVHSGKNLPYLARPPEDLKGVFVRNYRWGAVDVLDPKHCDFAAMRTAILSTHLKLLKIRTKEVLYEKYRTEKLLARRATAQISEEQRERLLEDLGL